MEELIKKIKELKGVKTVEPMSDKVVVTFEPVRTSIKVSNKEQLYFVWNKFHNWDCAVDGNLNRCVYTEIGGGWDTEENAKNKSTIIPFTQYIEDYNLRSEWEKYLIVEAKKQYKKGDKVMSLTHAMELIVGSGDGMKSIPEVVFCDGYKIYYGCDDGRYVVVYKDGKWAEIIPTKVEMVKGEIYYDKEESDCIKNIFRHKCENYIYSRVFKESGDFELDCHVGLSDNIKPATDKQKRKLIKTEVKNGYFHELNKD
jgi:hypothetical protein